MHAKDVKSLLLLGALKLGVCTVAWLQCSIYHVIKYSDKKKEQKALPADLLLICCLLKRPLIPYILHHCQQKEDALIYGMEYKKRNEIFLPFSSNATLDIRYGLGEYIYTYFNMLKYLLIFHVLNLVSPMVEITPIRVRFCAP